jgi:hypothetical protein
MMTMQEMILGRIEQMIKDHSLAPIQNGQWANTGSVYAMYGLKTLVKLTYDFQVGYFSVTVSPIDGKLEEPSLFRIQGERGVWNSVKYEDYLRIESLLHELGHAIVTAKESLKHSPGE